MSDSNSTQYVPAGSTLNTSVGFDGSIPRADGLVFNPQIKLGLAKKMSEIVDAVGYITKGDYNAALQYRFVSSNDVLSAVRHEMSIRNIFVTSEAVSYDLVYVKKYKTNKDGVPVEVADPQFIVRFRFVVIDADSGERFSCDWFGQSLGIDDKAINKCATAAMKYWILKMFMIPTTDEEDPDSSSGSTTSQAEHAAASRVESFGDIPEAPNLYKWAVADRDKWKTFFLASRKRKVSMSLIAEAFDRAVRLDPDLDPYENMTDAYGAMLAMSYSYNESNVPSDDRGKASNKIAIALCQAAKNQK